MHLARELKIIIYMIFQTLKRRVQLVGQYLVRNVGHNAHSPSLGYSEPATADVLQIVHR